MANIINEIWRSRHSSVPLRALLSLFALSVLCLSGAAVLFSASEAGLQKDLEIGSLREVVARQKATIEAMNHINEYARACHEHCTIDQLKAYLGHSHRFYLVADEKVLVVDGARAEIEGGRITVIGGQPY